MGNAAEHAANTGVWALLGVGRGWASAWQTRGSPSESTVGKKEKTLTLSEERLFATTVNDALALMTKRGEPPGGERQSIELDGRQYEVAKQFALDTPRTHLRLVWGDETREFVRAGDLGAVQDRFRALLKLTDGDHTIAATLSLAATQRLEENLVVAGEHTRPPGIQTEWFVRATDISTYELEKVGDDYTVRVQSHFALLNALDIEGPQGVATMNAIFSLKLDKCNVSWSWRVPEPEDA